jgi:hypothetical protein
MRAILFGTFDVMGLKVSPKIGCAPINEGIEISSKTRVASYKIYMM